MSTITSALVEYADNGNSRTYVAPDHTALRPRLVIQRRKVAGKAGEVAETSIRVVMTQVDANGLTLAAKRTVEVIDRSVVGGVDTAVEAASLALIREIVASDEFAAAITGQLWIK
jgi:hypothetical protein